MSILLQTRDEQDPSVLTLTMNRPEAMNSFNVDLCHALMDSIKAADEDPEIRVIIVTGAGRAFCAGADISQGFTSVEADMIDEETGEKRDWGGILNLAIYQCDTPIIAAINGAAMGVGATMTLPMDIRIIANTSKFGFPFTRRGIVNDGAASWFLPRLVGFARAQDWLLTGRLISAAELTASGLAAQAVAAEDVLPQALALARDMAQNCAPKSLAQNKQLMRQSMQGFGSLETGPYQAHMQESVFLNAAFTSKDCQEGVTAFFEKRAPKFQNYNG